MNAKLVAAGLLMSAMMFQGCSNRLCPPYSRLEVGNLISYQEALALTERYRNDRNKSHIWKDNERGGEDATCAWYRMQVIKDFILKLEDTVAKSGCQQNLVLGLKFYYIKYPESYGIPGLDYSNRHSLLIVPAYWDRLRNSYVDFDPGRLSEDNCTPKPFDSARSEKRNFILMISPGDGYIMNHGGVSPPPKNGGIFGQQ